MFLYCVLFTVYAQHMLSICFYQCFVFKLLIYLVCSEHMLSICTCVAYAESSSEVEFTYTQHMLYGRRGSEFKVRPRSRSQPPPRNFRPLPSCDPGFWRGAKQLESAITLTLG